MEGSDPDRVVEMEEGMLGHPEMDSFALTHLRRNDISRSFRKSKKVEQKKFINALNHLHFMGGQIFGHMVYPLTGEEFLFRLSPEPCVDNIVTCKVPGDGYPNLKHFEFKHLIIDDGKSIIMIQVEQVDISEQSLTVKLHPVGFVSSERQVKRFQCFLIHVTIAHKASEIRGRLEDFTPFGLRIRIDETFTSNTNTFNPGDTFDIRLFKQGQLVFSGECKCIRYEVGGKIVVVSPIKIHQERFTQRKIRNPRLNLIPTPKIIFNHPLTNKQVTYELQDLTTSGFSVCENRDHGLLMPGLIIPEASILFAGGYKIPCAAHVVYANNKGRDAVKYGFAISDMDIVAYNQLFDIFTNASDVYANFTREVGMDALWEFFFESGFIYPKKYISLSCYKEKFKQTYERLYHNSPEVFANFTYQKNGTIYGHVSIIRAYDRTWMIHHLAAKPMGRKRTGLLVLNHVLNYFDGLYRIPSVGMDYMIFYFRPENRFPDHFFGGFCRELKNPKGCSIDCFAYLNCILPRNVSLPSGWTVQECTSEDLVFLHNSYERISGGLMLDAFCLKAHSGSQQSIDSVYNRYYLKRRSTSFVLKFDDQPKAFFLVDESDMGVNLSDLLNSIKVIVSDGVGLAWGTIQTALGIFTTRYIKEKVPVLIYPYTFMDDQGVGYDTRYNLWVLNSLYGDKYTECLKNKAKIRFGKLFFKYLLSRFRRG